MPWEKADPENPDFGDWINKKHTRTPWPRISIAGLQFLRKVLEFDTEKRIRLEHIACHSWYNKNFEDEEAYSTSSKKRMKLNNTESHRLIIIYLFNQRFNNSLSS